MTNNTVEMKCRQEVRAHRGIHKQYKSEESSQGLSIDDYKYSKGMFDSRDTRKPLCRAGPLPLDKSFSEKREAIHEESLKREALECS